MTGPTSVMCAILFGTVFGVLSASLSKALRYEAPDDCKSYVEGREAPDAVALVCRVRTINSELDKTNFSIIQSQHTVRLRLECDDLFYQSSLAAGSFANLVELRDLSIEYCKIGNLSEGAFRGLKQLRNLTVKTHNIDWSAMTLKVSSNIFTDELRMLERLDLGENNIWSLPEGIFCPLYSLEFLNLTHNRIREVSSFKFTQHTSEKCGGSIKIIDLSKNKIDNLPSGQLSGLSTLQKLYLQENGLSYVADRALEGLSALKILKLSNNRLVSLPPELFSDTRDIHELYLKNNSINVLAPGLFNELTQLQVLDISQNELTSDWINTPTFAGLVRLVVLDLAFNRIQKLEASVFRELYSLQILQLNDNYIDSIPDNTFADLYNVHTLNMSNNRLTQIKSDTFNGLFVLSFLDLENNKITSIDPEALRNSSDLKTLLLNKNQLLTVPEAISKVPKLIHLDLGKNHINTLTTTTFEEMKYLTGLRLTDNYITNITKGIFDKLPNLKALNLAANKIHTIEIGSFDANQNLETVRLDTNYLKDFRDLFSKLPNLIGLNVSDNQLTWFDYAHIPTSLKLLDIQANYIHEFGNYFDIDSSLSLIYFDASSNLLKEITGSAIPDSVQTLILNNNKITKVQSYTFFKKPNLTKVEFAGNQITSLDQNSLRITAVPPEKDLPEFRIDNNPYQCDCSMEWLQKVNAGNRARTQPKLVNMENIYCQLMYNRGRSYLPLLEVAPYQFLCTYETHCFSLCHCCDFDACDCEMICPYNCTCYHDQLWSANVVDCSSRGYVERLPDQIPMDATQLYLDGNDLRSLNSHALIGRKKLKILYLNDSNIETIQNRTFNGLRELEILRLDRNKLNELKGYEFEGLDGLKEIYLQRNRIATILNTTFTHLKLLKVLNLDHNRIVEFSVWSLPISLLEITLSSNPWSCDCEYTEKLREWMIRGDAVLDLNQVRCLYNTTDIDFYSESTFSDNSELGFYVYKNDSVCTGAANIDNSVNGNLTATKTILKQQVMDYMPLLVITLVIFAVVVSLILFLFIFRQELRVWFHSKFGVRLFQHSTDLERDDRDKLFDAFISYSSKDEAWVAEVLAPALEPNYKLCLHYRDFPVGAFLADTIVQAVESSRRTIMILSENFIKSEWCRFEFKSAHHQVLRDRRRRLIVVLLGEVPQKDLDPDIRLYLKTNVYLQWGEKLFWEKLRYALPDIQRRRGSSRGPHVHHHVHRHPTTPRAQGGGNTTGNANPQRTVAIHI
ncbi:toll-like receptor Tollo [Onthophagus taurus]|uniref:toll-like receptor Tollo n=1 Tax=Onthophagus taurus TaxID=166361 RepID=UPI000C20E18B|nr:toll-like receptor Tollo [Onthophagus taurus]